MEETPQQWLYKPKNVKEPSINDFRGLKDTQESRQLIWLSEAMFIPHLQICFIALHETKAFFFHYCTVNQQGHYIKQQQKIIFLVNRQICLFTASKGAVKGGHCHLVQPGD